MTNRNEVDSPDIRDSGTETLKQTHRETKTEIHRQRERHTRPQTHRLRQGKQTDIHTYIQTDTQTDRQIQGE